MRRVSCRFLWCVPALVGSMWSCAECDREGCDALRRPAARQSASLVGVAGVVASASDLVSDGCQECPLGEATLEIWSTDTLVTSAAEATARISAREPDVTALASGRYEQELAPGAYLLCVRPSCIGVSVAAGGTTVNIQRREGPTGFFVGAADTTAFQEDFGFEVGPE